MGRNLIDKSIAVTLSEQTLARLGESPGFNPGGLDK